METENGQKKASSADLVFETLKTKIENHYWYPGDRLPSENDLAEEYGVSRVTVRTALHKLSALGLVETLTGGGTYISKFDFFKLISSVSGIMFNNISHSDISTFRTAIETATIDLLSQKQILTRYVRELQTCIAKMEKAAKTENREQFAVADYEFHLGLCKMTENGMFVYAYELLYSTLLQYFQEHYQITPEDSRPADLYYYDAIHNHQKILDSVVSGDFARAKRIITHMATSTKPILDSEL